MLKLVISLIFPIFISIAANSLWLTTEASSLARMNPDYVSFITYLGPWFFITMAMFESIGTPLTILTARYYRNDVAMLDRVRQQVRVLLCCAYISSLVIGTIYLVFVLKPNSHTDVYLKNLYLFYGSMVASIIPWSFRLYFSALCAGHKKTFVGAFSACTFLFLKLTFFFLIRKIVPFESSFLIGLSTFLAMSGSAMVSYLFFRRFVSSITHSNHLKLEPSIVRTIFLIGAPLMAIHLLSAADSYFFLSMFERYGEKILSNLTVMERVRRLCLLPIISISIGMSIYISSELSEKNKTMVLKMIGKVCSITCIVYLVSVPFLKLMFPYLIKVMTGEDPYFYSIALNILNYEVWAYPVLALGLISEGIFEGLGVTYPNLVVFVVVIVFGRILPITSAFSFNPVYSLQYVYPISHSLHIIGFLWCLYYFKGRYTARPGNFSFAKQFHEILCLLKIKRREI